MFVLPEIIETIGRNKKTFSIPTKLYEQSIITLFEEIDDDTSYAIITQLLYLDSLETTDDIKLYINSPGGSVTAGLAIIDTINTMKRKVQTIGIGSCASMAALLLLSGTGERKALKNTRVMLHSVSGGSIGNYHDIKINFIEGEYLQKKMMTLVSNSTNLSLEEVEKLTERDCYMSTDECIKNGIIDSVVP